MFKFFKLYEKIELCVQILLSVLGCVVNVVFEGALREHLIRKRIFTLRMNIRYSYEK